MAPNPSLIAIFTYYINTMRLAGHFLILFSLFFVFSAYAQPANRPAGPPAQQNAPKGKVTGRVLDTHTSAPVEYATIGLFRVTDSVPVTGNVTNAKGEFMIEAPYGRYYLNVDFIGYKARTMPAFEVSEANAQVNAGVIKLETSATSLSDVVIEAEQSQYQVGIDKKVFNVGKDLTAAGASASEVLQNVPSVTVDMDGNVALRGSGGVRILIDGKPSGLTGVSKADILSQIPASSIESIEVITNPSAKYDSEGMAGIINIVLKKEKKNGFNGMVSLNAGTWHRYNGSVNVNYNTGKLNLFGGYDARRNNSIGYGISERTTVVRDSLSYLDQYSDNIRSGWSHNLRAGFDYRITDKSSITISSLYKTSTSNNTSDIEYKAYDSNRALTSIFARDNTENDVDDSFDISANYRKDFKKKGQVLTADALFSNAVELEKTDIVQQYYHTDRTPVNDYPVEQYTVNDGEQQNMMGQLDYVHPIGEKGKIETGAKFTGRKTDTGFGLRNLDHNTSEWINDPSVSYHFEFEEQVYAGYGIFSSSYKSFGYKIGARVEQTFVRSFLYNTKEENVYDYIDLFPSIHLGQDLENKNKVTLSYTRRINRPSIGNLNPFDEYQDPYNLRKGNPGLRPEYVTSLDAGHSKYWNKMSIASGLYYRYTDNAIGRIRRLDTISGITVTTFENFATSINYGAEFTLTANPAKWIRAMWSFNYYRNIMDVGEELGSFGSDAWSWNTRLNTNITVWKNLDIQVTGHYRAPMVVPMGTIRPMYGMDLGVKKDVLKGKGSLSFRISDVLNSQRFEIDAAGPGWTNYMVHRRDTRAAYLGFSYRINSYKEKPARRNDDMHQGGDMF